MSNNKKEHLDKIRELSIQTCKNAKKHREEEYLKTPKLCLHCGKPIPYEDHKRKKFCNSSCAASYNNTKRVTVEKKPKYCKYCGKLITKSKGESWTEYQKRKYCCFDCYVHFNTSEYLRKWKSGEVSGSIPSGGINDTLRKYLLDKYNNQCAICGWNKVNPYTKTVPLEIHHIDRNSDNNTEENLIVLCPCCHSLTKNYKGANINLSKRSKYRKEYKKKREGKA